MSLIRVNTQAILIKFIFTMIFTQKGREEASRDKQKFIVYVMLNIKQENLQ